MARRIVQTVLATYLAGIVLAVLLANPNGNAADSWTGHDKALHLAGGAGIAAAVTAATASQETGFLVGATVGAGKELWDRKHPPHVASWRDFTATAVGAYLGAKVGGLFIDIAGRRLTLAREF